MPTSRHLIFRLLNRLGILSDVNLQAQININGSPINVPLIGAIGLNNLWPNEVWLDGLVAWLLRKRPGVFIDVGINIGQTLIKVKSISAKQSYIGFEPNPVCVAYVDALIRANNFRDCRVVPIGLGEKSTVGPLFACDRVDSAASVVNGFRDREKYQPQQYVAVQAFDDVSESLDVGQVAILKVDVEGAESETLVGARKMLAKSRPYILCEVLPIYDGTSTQGQFRKRRQTQMESLLKQLDYRLSRIDHTTGKVTWLESIETHAKMEWCDYLFCPKEEQTELDDGISARRPE